MNKKTAFNRVDIIKDKVARAEIARAHAMVSLLSLMIIALLWVLHYSTDTPAALVVIATILLSLTALFSAGVVLEMVRGRK